jgi:4-hydroxyphenylpyruvate dioxygenase
MRFGFGLSPPRRNFAAPESYLKRPMDTTVPTSAAHAASETDFVPLHGIDHVEFYVGNAKQSAYYYRRAFGMKLTAYAGLETGVRDRASYVLEQGKIRLVLTTALVPDSPIADHVKKHGDGVKVIAFTVDDAEMAFHETVHRGAKGVQEPFDTQDDHGVLKRSSIEVYGETIHTFVDRSKYNGVFAPGYVACPEDPLYDPTGLVAIDHMVGNVGWNQMNHWVAWYEKILGFHVYLSFDDKDISTEYSALMSKVMASGTERIKFPINEPAKGRKKSQIEEYVEWYYGAGVQHIALLTGDILETVAKLRARGVEFLRVPDSYYDDLLQRVGNVKESIDDLRRQNILVDHDEDGYMLQLFTKPVEDRPTVFYEIIQRRGAKSFGKGNFRALFESIEREQETRGNL